MGESARIIYYGANHAGWDNQRMYRRALPQASGRVSRECRSAAYWRRNMSSSRLGFDISLAGRAPAKRLVTMHACNTPKRKGKFLRRPRVSHHSGASPSAFDHDWTQIEGAAPLRQDSRVPRLSTYPRALVPGYSQPHSGISGQLYQSSPRSWLSRTISLMNACFCLSSRLVNKGSAASATLR